MRTLLLITLAAFVAGCGQDGPTVAMVPGEESPANESVPVGTSASPSERPSPEPTTTEPAPTAASSAVTSASPRPSTGEGPRGPATEPTSEAPRELGQDEDARIGQPYRYRLLTHCGIEAAWWNGGWWDAEPPLSDGNGNPPPGWDNPSQEGVMVQVSEDRLEFTGDEGQRASFVPRPPEAGAPPPCD